MCCKDETNWFADEMWTEQSIRDRGLNMEDNVVAASSYFLCEGGECGTCATRVLGRRESDNFTYQEMLDEHDQ